MVVERRLIGLAGAAGAGLGLWLLRDALAQNSGLAATTVLYLGLLSVGVHAIAAAVSAGALAAGFRRATVPISKRLRDSLAIGLPVGVLVFANAAIKLGDRLPGGSFESPKAILYPLAMAGAAAISITLTRLFIGARRPALVAASLCLAAGLAVPTWTDAWPAPAPPSSPPASATVGSAPNRTKVVFLALDGFDWRLGGRLAASGTMPNLRDALGRGASGELQPVSWLSPIAWTTAMTGRRPLDHGVLSFTGVVLGGELVVFADGVGHSSLSFALKELARVGVFPRRRMSIADRKTPALWDIATEAGKRVAVLNWLIAEPAQDLDGIFAPPGAFERPPESKTAPVAARSAISIVVREVAEAYPGLKTDEVAGLAALRVAARLVQENDLDLVLAYAGLADTQSHVWELDLPALTVERGQSPTWSAVEAAYAALDQEIGRVVGALGDEWQLLIASDHGWNYEAGYPGHAFPVPAGAYLFCCDGTPDFDTASNDFHAVDIAPTILAFLGVPVSGSMQGYVPFTALRKNIERVESHAVERSWPEFLEATLLPRETGGDARALERLRALGYVR